MPISARHGRSWLAACSTHSASAIASPSADEVGQRDRVDQRGAGAVAAQLHQVGALAVAVAGGPLGVDGDRAGAGGEAPRRRRPVGLGVVDDGWDAVARLEQRRPPPRCRRRSSALSGVGTGGTRHRRTAGRASAGPWRSRRPTDVRGRSRGAGCRDGASAPEVTRRARRLRSADDAGAHGDATISARSPVPSLRAIRARWLLTVSADRPSASPISLFDWPSATSCSTSTSRPDSSEASPSLPPGRHAGRRPAGRRPPGRRRRRRRAPGVRRRRPHRAGALEQVALRAGDERGAHRVGVVGRGEHDQPPPALLAQLRKELEAAAVGEAEVQHG